MAAKANTLPILLDATLDMTVEGGPIGGQTLVERSYWNRVMDNSTFMWFIGFSCTYWLWVNIYMRTWYVSFKWI